MFKFIFLVGIALGVSALATNLDFELANGGAYKSQTFSGSGDFSKTEADSKNHENTYNWNASYGHTATEVTSSSGGTVKDNTNDFTGGIGLETTDNITGNMDLSYSNSPEEGLSSFGTQFSFGMSFNYGKATKSESGEEVVGKSKFVPKYGFEVGIAQNEYRQNYSSAQTRPNGKAGRPLKGEALIGQRSLSLALKWRPLSWVSGKVTTTVYSYDKDVAQFAQYLDASPTLSSSSLGGLLSGFPASSAKLNIKFYIGDDWDLGLSTSRSTAAIEQTSSSASKAILSYSFLDSWQASVGMGVSRTEATSTVAQSSDTQTLLGVNKDF
jgi:hypothetical protein